MLYMYIFAIFPVYLSTTSSFAWATR